MYFTGITIAVMTFLTIGIWHPIVIKTEYYWGTRPWILYLLIGIVCCLAALFVENVYISSFLGVFGASSLWGIGELFSQRKRVLNVKQGAATSVQNGNSIQNERRGSCSRP